GPSLNGHVPMEIWQKTLSRYPSLHHIMKGTSLCPVPGKLIATERLQRMATSGFGQGWAALPHTIGFVDPLHSTGIAHTLCGVEKLATLLNKHWGKPEELYTSLQEYEKTVQGELFFLDVLVAGCYRSLSHFGLFTVWTMLYFAVTVAYERKRLQGYVPPCFLQADNPELRNLVDVSYTDLL